MGMQSGYWQGIIIDGTNMNDLGDAWKSGKNLKALPQEKIQSAFLHVLKQKKLERPFREFTIFGEATVREKSFKL